MLRAHGLDCEFADGECKVLLRERSCVRFLRVIESPGSRKTPWRHRINPNSVGAHVYGVPVFEFRSAMDPTDGRFINPLCALTVAFEGSSNRLRIVLQEWSKAST